MAKLQVYFVRNHFCISEVFITYRNLSHFFGGALGIPARYEEVGYFFFAWNVNQKNSGRPLPAVVKGFFLRSHLTHIPLEDTPNPSPTVYESISFLRGVWGSLEYLPKVCGQNHWVFVVLNFTPPVDIFQLSPWGWVIVIWADRLEGGFCHIFPAFFLVGAGHKMTICILKTWERWK